MIRSLMFAFFLVVLSFNSNAQEIGVSKGVFNEGAVVKPSDFDYERPDANDSIAMQALSKSRKSLEGGAYPLSNKNDHDNIKKYDDVIKAIYEHDKKLLQSDAADHEKRQAGFSIDLSQSQDILYMFSLLEVQPTGKVVVTETIKVSSATPYKNGFVRSFPLSFSNSKGERIQNSINIMSVFVNGNQVLFDTKVKNGSLDLYIKYSHDFVKEPINTINISYRIGDVLTFHDNGETEFYLEMIGNPWDKRILNLGAAIVFVNGTEVVENFAFISDKPEKSFFKMAVDDEKNIGFVADEPLLPGENFSLVIKWKSGVVDADAAQFSIDLLLEKYGLLVTSCGAILLLVFYYSLLPFFIRKDKDFFAKRINSLRHMSPATLRYTLRKRFDNKNSVVAVLDMIVKTGSKVQIVDGNVEIVAGNRKNKKNSWLFAYVKSSLFPKNKKVMSFNSEDKNKLKKLLKSASFFTVFEAECFFIKQNIKYIFISFLFSLMSLIGGAFMSLYPGFILVNGFIVVVSGFLFVFLGYLLAITFKRVKNGNFSKYLLLIIAFVAAILLLLYGAVQVASALGLLSVIIMMLVPFIALAMHIVLKTSGITARYIHDSFNAFKQSLITSKEIANEKLLWSNFDKFLPYALALDIESEYGQRYFGDGQKVADGYMEYVPQKYRSGAKSITELSDILNQAIN